MKRLSMADAIFLYTETPETPMHVGSVTIFKPASRRDDLFARFREHVAARLDLLPSSRRRLEATPLGIDHPAWVIEDNLDLDYHVRHAALPKPGGMQELRSLLRDCPLFRSIRPTAVGVPLHRGAGGRRLRRLHQGASQYDGRRRRHGELGVTTIPPQTGTWQSAESGRRRRRRAVRHDRADQHCDRRFRSPGLARGHVAARRHQGADQGRASFRSERALSVRLYEGHAADGSTKRSPAIGSSQLRRCRCPRSGRSPGRGAPRSTTSCSRSLPVRCGAISANTRRCPRSR